MEWEVISTSSETFKVKMSIIRDMSELSKLKNPTLPVDLL